ncbi:PspC domain-containing protein [Arthrobacter sp. NyZ413]|uniref:PspC domain-containing protein n=1 Tax=Arthrobacter sp. NyZ413 TaxID=3144669 RepID=UPI002CD05EBD|nr:PspC domain-containing protein [Arthrobacter sp.]
MNSHSMNPEDPERPADLPQQPHPEDSSNQADAGSTEEPAQPGTGAGSHTGTGAPSYAAPTTSQNFFDWIRSQGIRRGPDRWVGGVASGIAHRFGIDPLIVRGIFIVLALFAGIGILLYGLAWAFLPEPDGRIHAQEAWAGRWSAGMTGALISTIIGLPGLGHGFWGWGWNGLPGLFWTLFWVGGAAYLIYFLVQRNKTGRRGRNGRQAMGTPDYATAAGAAGTATGTTPSSPYDGAAQSFGAVPPSGTGYSSAYSANPYGSGAYGTDGPSTPSGPFNPTGFHPAGGQPAQPPRPMRQGPGAAIVAVSLGAALLAGGTVKLLDAGNTVHLGGATDAVAWAVGAGVLGLGILVAGLRGRTSGLLGFLAVVALVIGAVFNVASNAGQHFQLRNAQWSPVSIDDASKGYNITAGDGTVDLTKLNLSAPLASDVVVPMDVTASNIKLVIPANVPVELQADMTFANLKQDGGAITQSSGGTRNSFNTDKPGAKLVIKLDGTFSNVTVQEGN